ncbi:magnesium/cobalt transporter CorA [Neorhodopirellula pilleata]|uniref:Magnesium transport protein CorA n=1 Tax=Neorhodopirellula pilleata TaxID=2714738 RepID=A0A5C6AQS8_9BACT|nr:magnesium/cobalt transporter CorA [Neorhodopirellula pilleata]TWU01821.1 Magnesium transport protein CorA [Neorhodopirellula pilleata]
MMRTLEFETKGEIQGKAKESVGDEFAHSPKQDALIWIDIEAPTESELAMLANRFGFHPLEIEDCTHFDQRPKLEDYDDHLFIVTHGFCLLSTMADEAHIQELHSFLGKNYLVTVHDEPSPSLNGVWSRLAADATAARRGVDFIRYLIADAVVDSMFPVIDRLAIEIEGIEEALLNQGSTAANLKEMLRLKRQLISMRRVLPQQRDVLSQLSKREGGFISEKTSPYLRDVYDHLLRINESIELNRELLGNVLDAFQWVVSQRTNDIMKRLTIVSAIFLPLTFITGFFGQNFESLPFDSKGWMSAMLVSCAIVPVTMLWFFLRSRWL